MKQSASSQTYVTEYMAAFARAESFNFTCPDARASSQRSLDGM